METAQKWKKRQILLRKLKEDRDKKKKDSKVSKLEPKPEDRESLSLQNLTLDEIRDLIPHKCFRLKESKALMYLAIDLGILLTSLFTYRLLKRLSLPGLLIYWNFYGFALWSLFAIGHDCVHLTFANGLLENEIVGRICFLPLLLPYSAFKYDHNLHHLYIGQYQKHEGYENMFFTRREDHMLPIPVKAFLKYLSPIFGYSAYLISLYARSLGLGEKPIGIPLAEAVLDAVIALTFLLGMIIFGASGNLISFFNMYYGCFLAFSMWIFIASYMQRFKENVNEEGSSVHDYLRPRLFDSNAWNFVVGALTVGNHGIGPNADMLQHDISACASAHYLFPNEIPHYNLRKAHEALVKRSLKLEDSSYSQVRHQNIFFYLMNALTAFSEDYFSRFEVCTTSKEAKRDGRTKGITMTLIREELSEIEKQYASYEKETGLSSVLIRREEDPKVRMEIDLLLNEGEVINEEEKIVDGEDDDSITARRKPPRDSLHSGMSAEDPLNGTGAKTEESRFGLPINLKTRRGKTKVLKSELDERLRVPLKRTKSQIVFFTRAKYDKERRMLLLKEVHFSSVTRYEYTRPDKLYGNDKAEDMLWERRAKKRKNRNLLDSVKNDETLAALQALSPSYAVWRNEEELRKKERRRLEEERREMQRTRDMKAYLAPVVKIEEIRL